MNEEKKVPLTDEELSALSPALSKLVGELEDIARREPSPSVSAIASNLAAYFRTPD